MSDWIQEVVETRQLSVESDVLAIEAVCDVWSWISYSTMFFQEHLVVVCHSGQAVSIRGPRLTTGRKVMASLLSPTALFTKATSARENSMEKELSSIQTV